MEGSVRDMSQNRFEKAQEEVVAIGMDGIADAGGGVNDQTHIDQEVFAELVEGILHALQGQVIRIVLYGSVARGTQAADSDIDVAIFIAEKLDTVMEDRLSDVVVDMNLKYNKIFSVIDIEESVYRKWRKVTPFYQNVDKEGIVLWTAA